VAGAKYSLEKYQPFGFNDFIKIANRTTEHDIENARQIALDKHSRMLFLQCLSAKTADEVNERIEHTNYFSSSDSRKAQQKIINAVNRTADKFKQGKGKYSLAEVLKD
jgi:flagellar motor switch protein FliG